jgi:hypothetical protein
MAEKSIVQLVADMPAPDRETTEKYYRWLEDVHCPDLFKYKGIRRYLNCRKMVTDEVLKPVVTDYPEYLSINEFYSKKDLDAFPESPETKYASKDSLKTWGNTIGKEKKWLVAYEETKTYERKREKKDTKGNRVIHIVSPVPPSDPETARKFYKWYDDEHFPQIFEEFKGVAKASSLKRIEAKLPSHPAVTDYPYSIAMFEYFSRNDFDEIMSDLKNKGPAPVDWGPGVGYVKVWVANYEVVKSWER